MRADAEQARHLLALTSPHRSNALLMVAVGRLLAGELDEADELFADVAEEALQLGAPEAAAVALGERAAIAIVREAWVRRRRSSRAGRSGSIFIVVVTDVDSSFVCGNRHPTRQWLAQQIVRHPRGTRRRPIWYATMMAHTGTPSQVESGRWGFGTARHHRDRRGRIPMSSA